MPTSFVRYHHAGRRSYGQLDGETVRELKGRLFDNPTPTGTMVKLADVRLLAPVEPSKVIAVGRNYKSHLGERPPLTAPGLFAKFPNSIIGTGDAIVFPPGAADVHYEGEMVVVIGRRAKNVAPGQAGRFIFGVTAGNDVSERAWQKNDLQWLRAKSSDTFGPLGPAVATGLDYNDLLVETRLNGEVRQSQQDARPDLRRGHHHQLRHAVRHARTRRSHLHRDARHDPGDESRRRRRGRGGRGRDPAQHGRRSAVLTSSGLPEPGNERRDPTAIVFVRRAELGGELAFFNRNQHEDRHHQERSHAIRREVVARTRTLPEDDLEVPRVPNPRIYALGQQHARVAIRGKLRQSIQRRHGELLAPAVPQPAVRREKNAPQRDCGGARSEFD
jgi:hypothetical protein